MEATKLQYLFSTLVAYRHNIHMLHWKVCGEGFDCVHTLMDSYLDKFNDMVDDVAEMILSFNTNPFTLEECMDCLKKSNKQVLVIESDADFTKENVFNAIKIMFDDLCEIYTDIHKEYEGTPCPSFSKLDEHRYWLLIENNYKNERRLKK